MNPYNTNDKPRSRFQVTPSVDIESQLIDLNNTSSTVTTTNREETTNGDFWPYSGLARYFSQVDETEADKSLVQGNTATTTSTSSSSSFYNTIYKYNKLKQNNGSMDAVYYPIQVRRPSHSVHSMGITFYNERVLVYNFLQRPTGLFAISYHVGISVAVVVALVLTIMSTSSNFTSSLSRLLNLIDYLIIVFFIVEYLARLWASECVSYYRGWRGKIRFFRNPIRMIDFFVILISVAVLVFNAKGELLITSLRGVRFIQIFQMVRLDFKFRPWRMMASVVYSQRIHLAIVFYMGFLALILISFVIYFVEKDYNKEFDSLASSMWWAVITLCTIGYGDMYPKTSTGKFLSCICSLIGVSIFALPAGILGTGLALKVQEQQRQLKMSKRKQPAARLIQCAWKCFISEKELKSNFLSKSITTLNGKESAKLQLNRSALWKRFETNKNKNKLLNKKEIYALHFVFTVKLCIAKRDFVNAFKPYDIKDVLEQYSAGHADMLAKIRTMDHRLERIQANHLSNKAHQEFRIQLAAHLNKIELNMQKMQSNISEMQQQKLIWNMTLTSLLNYLIGQQRNNTNTNANTSSVAQLNSTQLLKQPATIEQITKQIQSSNKETNHCPLEWLHFPTELCHLLDNNLVKELQTAQQINSHPNLFVPTWPLSQSSTQNLPRRIRRKSL